MGTLEIEIIKVIVAIGSVIGLLWCGILIGREFGTFENYILAILDKLKKEKK